MRKAPYLTLFFIFLTLLLFQGSHLLYVNYSNKSYLLKRNKKLFSKIIKYYNDKIEKYFLSNELILKLSAANPIIKQFVKNKDRAALFKYYKPMFNKMKKQLDVNLFYFHDNSGRVILRMHSKNKFGDKPERLLIKRCMKKKKMVHGFELGYSDFSLRAITPVFINEKIIGFLETGVSIITPFREIGSLLSTSVALVFMKNKIKPDYKWKNRGVSYKDYLLFSCKNIDNSVFLKIFKKTLADGSFSISKIKFFTINNEKYSVIYLPLANFHNDKLGYYAFIKKSESLSSYFNKNFLYLVLIYIVIYLILIIITSFVLHKKLFVPYNQLEIALKNAEKLKSEAESFNVKLIKANKEIEQFQMIVENANFGFIIFDLYGRITYINPYFENKTNCKLNEIKNKSADDIFIDSGDNSIFKMINDVLNGVKLSNQELLVKTEDGKEVNFIINSIRIGGDAKMPVFVAATCVDVSDLKESEKQREEMINELKNLAESERHIAGHYKTIWDESPVGMVLLDKQGIILRVNREFKRISGVDDAADIVGENIFNVFQNRTEINNAKAYFSSVVSGDDIQDKTFSFEYSTIEFKNNLDVLFVLRYDFVSISDKGKVNSIVGFFKDVTDSYEYELRLKESRDELKNKNIQLNKKNEEMTEINRRLEIAHAELLAALEKAKEVNKLKGEFLDIISHELKTPLFAIIGFSDVLAEDELSDEQQESLNYIQEAGKNLLKLVENIIELSTLEAKQSEIEKREFQLKPIIDEIINIHNYEINKKKLNITYDIDNCETIVSDQTRVKHILINLFSNAIKFTEKGFIKISAMQNDTEFILNVQDSGIGIDEKNKDLIFGMFSQVEASYTRRYGGIGIGLAIVKKLVNSLKGKLWFENTEEGGTTFYFSLPK